MNEKFSPDNKICISVSINALGCESGYGDQIPLAPVLEGKTIDISAYLPPMYHPYVKPINARLTDEGIEITSDYGNAILTKLAPNIYVTPSDAFRTPQIGLSYATCTITINLSK